MTPPINIDGTQITGASIDGQTVSEITVDGTQVFTATSIPDTGSLHEYDARDLSLADGDSVTSWPDDAGNDDLSTGTAPTFRTGRVNGAPAVVANRSNSEFLTTTFSTTVTQPFDVFLVVDIDDATVTNRPFGSTDPVEAAIGQKIDTFAGSVLAASGSSPADPELFVFSYDGPNSEIRQNQSTIASGDAGTSGMAASDVFRSANNPNQVGGAIPYIAWFDPSASGYSRSDIESALVDIFGPF